MRLFIASPVNISDNMMEFLQQINQFGNIRVPLIKNFHITYIFLGETDDNALKEISMAIHKIPPVHIIAQISKIAIFHNFRNSSAIVLVLDSPEFLTLYKEAIKTVPFPVKAKRQFIPHITVGRTGKNVENLDLTALKLPEESIEINKICLYNSTLYSSGPVYEEIICNH
ncbi:MAG: RNA 2',3'-cyclic phosphodiesterase [Ferroplasma sp.]